MSATSTLRDRIMDKLRPILFRGKHRLVNPFIAKLGQANADVFGASMTLDLSNEIDRTVYLGCYEPINVHRFLRILKPGDTVIDVGANIGFFTILAARCVGPRGRVFGFEPHPHNFGPLQETVARNGLSQVNVFRVGLDEKDGEGEVAMADQALFANRTASMVVKTGDPRAVRVPTRSIDGFVAERGIERIDLLKIDVDGFETRILKGMRETLAAGKVRHLIIELNAHWLGLSGSSMDEVEGLLAAGGLRDVSKREWLSSQWLGPRSEDMHFERTE